MVSSGGLLGQRRVVRDDREVRRPGATAAAAVAAVVLLSGAGCSTASDQESDNRGAAPHAHVEGPWAAEFENALASGVGETEAEILSDGVVTPLELEQAHDGVRRCLADSGLTIDYLPDGGFDLGSTDGRSTSDDFGTSDAALRACEAEHDEFVTFLFEQTRRNPEKRDEATLVAECLVDAGLVGPGYGRDDFEAEGESESGAWSFDVDSGAGQQCLLDPLGLWRQP
jgi:hypothetical protein